MAHVLYRLGRMCSRHRRWVLGAWIVLLAVLGTGAATLAGATNNDFSIPGTESQTALEKVDRSFPQGEQAQGAARVVFAEGTAGSLTEPAQQKAVTQSLTQLGDVEGISGVSNPYQSRTVARDGSVAYADITFTDDPADVTDAELEAMQQAPTAATDAGVRVEFSGQVFSTGFGVGATEVLGVAVAAVVLVVTFGSLLAAGMTLINALIGVGIGLSGILILTGPLELGSTTPIMAMMLGLAVGIDYTLFIVSRFRDELTAGKSPDSAVAHAVATAGSSVVFAGLTVIIALAGLTVVNIPIFTQMGLAAAATVAVAVLIALTLLPAVLGFTGARLRPRGAQDRQPSDAQQSSAGARKTLSERWVGTILRRPAVIAVLGVLTLGVVAIPTTDLNLNLPTDGNAQPDTTQRQAYDLISEGFGPGANGPLLVLLESPSGDAQQQARAVAGEVNELPDVSSAAPGAVSQGGDAALLTVLPASGPTAPETTDLVHTLRDLDTPQQTQLSVTGQTAVNIDISDRVNQALPVYLVLVVGLALLLLTAVFRSLLVPIKAVVGFLLSVGASFGAVVAVFQYGWLSELTGVVPGPVMTLTPILLVGVLFGLAMDYEVFLVSRMREAVAAGTSPREAVRTGFRHGSRIVVAAGLIMISVFVGFFLTDEPVIKPIAFSLAFGVFVDAFLVRMTIVPAVLALLGRSAWWMPRWLGRILPTVDVEGSELAEPHAGHEQDHELATTHR